MNDITERGNTINDIVLTACNDYELYKLRKSILIVKKLEEWIYVNSDLEPLDRAKCMVSILEYWQLDDND